jgi:hypothetical protein
MLTRVQYHYSCVHTHYLDVSIRTYGCTHSVDLIRKASSDTVVCDTHHATGRCVHHDT